MTKSQSNACARLCAIGLTEPVRSSILACINKWKEESGVEWTVSRLKEFKLLYVKMLARQPYTPAWISLDGLGRPKGPFNHIFRIPASNKRQIMRAISALMVYSQELSPKVTPQQWKKFSSSVEKPSTDSDPNLRRLFPMTGSFRGDRNPIEELSLSPNKRVPIWCFETKTVRTVPETDVGKWFWDNAIMALRLGLPISNPLGTGVLDPVLQSNPTLAAQLEVFRKKDAINKAPAFAGKISFLQEPGYKLRAVANPNRVIQWYLEPLKEHLAEICKDNLRRGHDFTFDQSAGAEKVRSWLCDLSPKMIHSVDLSDATNHFPLRYQVDSLMKDRRFDRDFTPLLEDFVRISRAPWRVWDPRTREEREIRWTVGQPLGLGPSFFLFTSAHCALLDQLANGTHDDYVVLGDDVCIRGDTLNERYRSWLQENGVPISASKCLDSLTVAEFAGKIITRCDIFPQPKWRGISDFSFLDVAKMIGPRARSLLQKRQRDVFDIIATLPEWEGGLGMNPKGLPLEDRIRLANRVNSLLERESDLRTDLVLQELSRRRISFAIQTETAVSAESAPELDTDGVPTRNTQADLSFLKNTKEHVVPPRGDPRGKTTLEVLERKLAPILRKMGTSSPDVVKQSGTQPTRGRSR